LIADLGKQGYAAALSPNHRLLALVDEPLGNHPPGITLWDLVEGKKVKRLGGHWRMIGDMAFSPDSKQLASIEMLGGPIKLWSLEDLAPPASTSVAAAP
jgi:WD40 repeat protein